MVKKCLAAVLLLGLLAWAEMPVAPMLLMHIAHAEPAQAAARAATHRHQAVTSPHDCCPGLHKAAFPVPLLAFAERYVPCSDKHRCCFQQARNVPAPAQHKAGDFIGLEHVQRVVSDLSSRGVSSARRSAQPLRSPPLSIVLRI